jgi:hypothetical protein
MQQVVVFGKEADDPVPGIKSTELLDTVSVRLAERRNRESDPCGDGLFSAHSRVVWKPKLREIVEAMCEVTDQDIRLRWV